MSDEQQQQQQSIPQEPITEASTEIEPISAPPSTAATNDIQLDATEQPQQALTDESVNLEHCISATSTSTLAEEPDQQQQQQPQPDQSAEITPTDISSLLKELSDTPSGPTTTAAGPAAGTTTPVAGATASPAAKAAGSASSPSVDSNARSVHVGNVEYKTKESELEELFGRCGAIRRVTILNDFYTKRPKGCAYIEFEDPSSVESALLLTGTDFNGRQIKVTRKENRKKPPMAPFPTPFGRGGRFMPYPMPYPFMMPPKRFKQ